MRILFTSLRPFDLQIPRLVINHPSCGNSGPRPPVASRPPICQPAATTKHWHIGAYVSCSQGTYRNQMFAKNGHPVLLQSATPTVLFSASSQ
jgi:hypothetical protein